MIEVPFPQHTREESFPFAHNLMPVTDNLDGFRNFTEQYPTFSFCPYLADKTSESWQNSTSRRYMNQVLPGLLYVPVNIADGDDTGLVEFIRYADSAADIPAVNITQPHKSTPALREYFYGNPSSNENIDTLIKVGGDGLRPLDLNAPSFINWFEESVQAFKETNVVIVGVGGVGEPIAKHIDKKRPQSITLVDINDKSILASLLDSASTYRSRLSDMDNIKERTIVINASGKDGISDDTGLLQFLEASRPGTFVDLRPQLKLDIVEAAKDAGWAAYTGNGMNARNDYELLCGIMDYLKTLEGNRPSFEQFSRIVTSAS